MEIFFDYWRGKRREHYAGRKPNPGKRRAVVTMVHNEAVFFPIWLDYYSRFFGPADIHVLDNETTDGSADRGGFVRVPVAHGSVDHEWMVNTIKAYQRDLLDRYDVVLVTDVDEIVSPTPEFGTLGDYIDRLDEQFVNAIGYELIHLADREPAFRSGLAVLEQRRHWFANDAYDKPALAMVPMDWKPGFHERVDAETNFDPDLRLIHLHRMDFDICRERHSLRRKRSWGKQDLMEGWAVHNRIVRKRAFSRWFYEESGLEAFGIAMEIQQMPPSWRGLF